MLPTPDNPLDFLQFVDANVPSDCVRTMLKKAVGATWHKLDEDRHQMIARIATVSRFSRWRTMATIGDAAAQRLGTMRQIHSFLQESDADLADIRRAASVYPEQRQAEYREKTVPAALRAGPFLSAGILTPKGFTRALTKMRAQLAL